MAAAFSAFAWRVKVACRGASQECMARRWEGRRIPTALRLTIDASGPIDAVEVLDVNGRVVLRHGRPSDNTIDLGTLHPGIYTVLALTKQGMRTARVVRE